METDLIKLSEDFQLNLKGLRELLKLPERFEKKAQDISKKHDAVMLPPYIKYLEEKINTLKGKKNQERVEKMKKVLAVKIARYKELCPENIDENGKLKISIGKTYFESISKKKFFQEEEQLEESLLHKIHIEKAVLFNLICYLEKILADTSHLILKAHPEILQLQKKQICFSDLIKFASLEEARDDLINQEIEKLLFSSMSSFFDFFEKEIFKIEIPNLVKFKRNIVEVKERRNLLVHNGGKINQKYLNVVDAELLKEYGAEKEKEVKLEKNYLLDAIKIFELIGLEVIFMTGLKFKKEKELVGDAAVTIIYESIKNRDFFLAENLSIFLIDGCCSKYLVDLQKDYCKLNFWLTLKLQKKLDLTSSEIVKYDVTSKSNLIKLAYFTLIEDYEKAAEYILPSLNGEKNFTLFSYNDFPILKDLRGQKKAQNLIKEYKRNEEYKKGRETHRATGKVVKTEVKTKK